jgi:hypothetical protein
VRYVGPKAEFQKRVFDTYLMLEPMKMTHEAEDGKGPPSALF